MTRKIRLAIQECMERFATGASALRTLLREDPADFLLASIDVLQNDPDSPGQDQLLKLLSGNEQVIEQICDPARVKDEQALSLIQLFARLDPLLDTKLVRLLQRTHARTGAEDGSGQIERILGFLDAIPSTPRTAPALASMLRDPDPRLRAKLAKLVGRRVQNTRFAAIRQQESDPRVRANAIESLWGDKTCTASSILWQAARDENNRVVGNALLGLYQLSDQNAVSSILAMSVDARPKFRATAAWVMGQAADPRFLPALEKLTRDLYAPVRKNASKALKLVHVELLK